MIVRPERPGDIDVIRAVHDAAFGGGGEGRLVDALRAAAKLVVSLVAERDGEVVGHIGFSPVTSSAAARGLASRRWRCGPTCSAVASAGRWLSRALAQ